MKNIYANIAKKEYKKDSNHSKSNEDVYSADMQKIIMLPRIEQFKSAFFIRWLTAYNETFAMVTGKQIFAALWHEGISGQNDEDVAFLLQVCNAEGITL